MSARQQHADILTNTEMNNVWLLEGFEMNKYVAKKITIIEFYPATMFNIGVNV